MHCLGHGRGCTIAADDSPIKSHHKGGLIPPQSTSKTVIQHYYGPMETGNGKSTVRDMMESDKQEWLLNTNQGWAMWSARSAPWRY